MKELVPPSNPRYLLTLARLGSLSAFKVAVEAGLDLSEVDVDQRNCLHHAIVANRIGMVEFLMGKIPLESKDSFGRTPLHTAADYGYKDIVIFLLEQGAHLEAKSKYGWTTLQYAVRSENTELVKWLVENGASLEDTVSHIDGSVMSILEFARTVKIQPMCDYLEQVTRVRQEQESLGRVIDRVCRKQKGSVLGEALEDRSAQDSEKAKGKKGISHNDFKDENSSSFSYSPRPVQKRRL